MIKISGEYLIFVDEDHEAKVIKRINEFEDSLEFFFKTNNEQECHHELHELLKFIARNGKFLKIRGLQVADVVLPPKDITFSELKELWQLRSLQKEEKNK